MKANILKRLDDLEQKARMKANPKQPDLIIISWDDDRKIIEVIEEYSDYAATGKFTGCTRKTSLYNRLSDYTFRAGCNARVNMDLMGYGNDGNLYAFTLEEIRKEWGLANCDFCLELSESDDEAKPPVSWFEIDMPGIFE